MKKRFKKTRSGYKIDKIIVRIYLASIIFLAIIAWSSVGFATNMFYISCPDYGNICLNPVYEADHFSVPKEISDMEYLSPGFEYGIRPPFILNGFGGIAAAMLLLAVLINHLLHNKKKKNQEDVINWQK